MHIVCYAQERDGNFEVDFHRNRWTFIIRGPCLFIIFDFQQLLFLTNFDQSHGYRDRIEAILYTYNKMFFSVFVLFYFNTVKFFEN